MCHFYRAIIAADQEIAVSSSSLAGILDSSSIVRGDCCRPSRVECPLQFIACFYEVPETYGYVSLHLCRKRAVSMMMAVHQLAGEDYLRLVRVVDAIQAMSGT